MEIYSVPLSEIEIIKALLTIQLASSLKERREAIKELEKGGGVVSVDNNRNYMLRAVKTVRMPRRLCLKCLQVKYLPDFLGLHEIEHPWCAECRHHYPDQSEKLRIEATHGRGVDFLAPQRCQNPSCQQGGIIPLERILYSKKRASFCCTECRQAVQGPPPKYCKNPECGKRILQHKTYCSEACRLVVSPPPLLSATCTRPGCGKEIKRVDGHITKFCSWFCRVEHQRQTGHYKRASEKARSMLHNHVQATGEPPKYASRSQAVRHNNLVAPPRARLPRTLAVYGHELKAMPNGHGGYKAVVPETNIEVEGKTAKEVASLVRQIMREKGIV